LKGHLSLATASSRRKRIITIVIFFLISILVSCIGVLTPLSKQDADQINQEIVNIRNNSTAQSILENNLLICLAMFIPIFGPILGFYALYNSGVAIEAQVISNPKLSGISPVLAFFTDFLLPIIWLEFIAYSTAFAESFWLIRRAMQGLFKKEIKNTAILIAISASLLVVGAIVEIALIKAFPG
jgi:hypothetical protein